jgi:hypothetical protein
LDESISPENSRLQPCKLGSAVDVEGERRRRVLRNPAFNKKKSSLKMDLLAQFTQKRKGVLRAQHFNTALLDLATGKKKPSAKQSSVVVGTGELPGGKPAPKRRMTMHDGGIRGLGKKKPRHGSVL